MAREPIRSRLTARLRLIQISPDRFIEFGVDNYAESNTRFLQMNNNRKGLVIDGSLTNIEHVKGDSIYWRHDLTAVCAFVDKDNVNRLFTDLGFCGDIRILSIDIDGNNAFFVRADRIASLRGLTAEEGHVTSRSRDSRDENGRLTYISGIQRVRTIANMPVVDLESGKLIKIGDILGEEEPRSPSS